MSGKFWSNGDLPMVEDDPIRRHLNNLDMHKSMGPDRMRPQVLKALAGVIVRPLQIAFGRSW